MRAEVFENAAQIIEERGLTKEFYCGRGGRRCALGALYEAVGKWHGQTEDEIWGAGGGWPNGQVLSWGRDYERRLIETVNTHPRWSEYESVPEWNDQKSRTKQQVVAWLRETAQRVRDEA